MLKTSFAVGSIFAAGLLGLTAQSDAAVIAKWPFTYNTPVLAPTSVTQGVTVSNLTVSSLNGTGYFFYNAANGDYQASYGTSTLTFSVTVAPGYSFNIDSISFDGATNYTSSFGMYVESSADSSFTTLLTSASDSMPARVSGSPLSFTPYSFAASTALTSGNTYYFRIRTDFINRSYGLYMDNLQLNGTASAVPEPAAIGMLGVGALALLRRRR